MSELQGDTPSLVDELARKREERQEREARAGDLELRDRVREEARRTARRVAAAERARRRAGTPIPPNPSGSGGGASGAA